MHLIERCTNYDLNSTAAIGFLYEHEAEMIVGNDENDFGSGNYYVTPLQLACLYADKKLVKALCNQLTIDVSARGRHKGLRMKIPLCTAAMQNHIAIATILLDEGKANPNGVKSNPTIPAGLISLYSNEGHLDVPLYGAAQERHRDMIKLLLSKGAQINWVIMGHFGWQTALAHTSKKNQEALHEYLVSQGCLEGQVVMAMRDNNHPILAAIEDVNTDEVKRLYEKTETNLDVSFADGHDGGDKNCSMTPLMLAVCKGNSSKEDAGLDIINLLIGANANVEAVDEESWTALHWAAYHIFIEAATALIEVGGAHLEVKNKWGYTPLLLLAQESNSQDQKELLQYFIDKGANMHATTNKNETILHLTLQKEHKPNFEVFVLLLEAGADIDAIDSEGRTPLDIAMQANHREIVMMLEEYGASSSDTWKC